jgi:nitrate reductase gamma subunit
VYTVVPWLHSLVKLNPKVEYVVALPTVVKVHALLGFGLIALFPFTRLVHVVAYPVSYLWRSYQLVFWNRRPSR